MRTSWRSAAVEEQRIEAEAEGQYRLVTAAHEERLPYGELWLNAEIDSDAVELVGMGMVSLIQTYELDKVKLFINSPGGTTSDGQVLIDIMRSLPVPVWTINVSACHSMALSVFLAGQRRFAMPNSTFMAHDVSFEAPQEKLSEHDAYAKFAKKTRVKDAEYYASRTLKTKNWWLKRFTSADYWFDAEEALRLGVATDIVKPEHFYHLFDTSAKVD